MSDSLNCPNCGAPSTIDATACGYCGSRLATVACPACLGSMFVGSQFCPHCGAKAVEAAASGGTALHCPGCAGDMPSVRLGTTTMNSCDKCGSVWLTPDEFARLCSDREATGALAVTVGGTADSPPTSVQNKVRYVRCCVCAKTMNRVNFGRVSGVIVDVCKGHGVWFESDELRQVLAFIGKGGLQQSAGPASQFAQAFRDETIARHELSGVEVRYRHVTEVSQTAPTSLESFLKA